MKRILIVDDDPDMRKAIKRLLHSMGGDYEIHEAGDGVEAVRTIKEVHFHLVILDIKVPSQDGYDVCRALRKKSRMVKIIAISGFSKLIEGATIVALGANCYLEKPFDNEDFKTKVKELLAGGSLPGASA